MLSYVATFLLCFVATHCVTLLHNVWCCFVIVKHVLMYNVTTCYVMLQDVWNYNMLCDVTGCVMLQHVVWCCRMWAPNSSNARPWPSKALHDVSDPAAQVDLRILIFLVLRSVGLVILAEGWGQRNGQYCNIIQWTRPHWRVWWTDPQTDEHARNRTDQNTWGIFLFFN